MNKPPVDSSPGPAVTSKSAKERMREYRQRLRQDKEAYEAVKKKDRESKKAAYTPVAELSGRAHRAVKKRWKEGKRKRRAAKQETETQATQTPQTTEIQRTLKSSTQTFELSRQKVQSLLKKEQERKDLLLEIEILKNKVKSEEKKVEMYKKRCSRLSGEKSVDTPQKKMSKVLKEKKEHRRVRSKGVKRQLIYHFALLKQLKCLNKEKKKTLVSVCHGEILRKYKLTTVFRNDIGLYGKKNTAKKKTEHPFAQRIRDFFLRIDVSKIVAGKKNVVRKCKLVKQRRNLTDTLTNLFLKFKSENPGCKVSFATFWRYKPFWVGQPQKNDRDTCQCKYCENMKCFAFAMYKLGAIQTSRVNELVHQRVCSVNNKKCMFSDCPECEHKALPKVLHVNPDEPCSWNEWKTVTEERELKSGIKKKITLTKRVNESGVFADLEKLFYSELSKFKKHFFIMKTQYDHYSHVKSNLSQREVLIHVDFAENYVGKYNNQLQSVHFGASQPQISLHTGYFQTSSVLKSFCGISDSMEHSPESIWAYLTPVLTKIRSEYPLITTIHIFSDSPTQQYRQKNFFYLFCTEIFKRGFQLGYWNFFAPGHGKGIPDGIGAAMKRQADLRVKWGNIMSSKEFISELSKSESKVMLYEVKEKSFCTVPVDACKPVKDTMSLQQILCHKKGSLLYRQTSCTCSPASPHKDHGFKSHSIEKADNQSQLYSEF